VIAAGAIVLALLLELAVRLSSRPDSLVQVSCP
jgi:hypothetical protein